MKMGYKTQVTVSGTVQRLSIQKGKGAMPLTNEKKVSTDNPKKS
jgi:hypothetical protein